VRNSPIVRVDADGHMGSGIMQAPGNPLHGDPGGDELGYSMEELNQMALAETMEVIGNSAWEEGWSSGSGQSQQAQQQQSQATTAQKQDYIRSQTKAFGLPDGMGLATAQKESSFDQDLVGGKGEVGLFQIMPTFAGKTIHDDKGKGFKVDFQKAATDWQYNVKVGLSILKDNYTWAQSHVAKDVVAATFAHYNGGRRSWKYYTNPRSPVNHHVFGYTQHRRHHAPRYIPGYMDYYHEWGGSR
jgi:hypothetical protein